MQALSWPSIGFFCLFGIFVFYQQLHVKHFHGSSQSFALALNISGLLGSLTGLTYLVYYDWHVVWWAPIVIFVIGILAAMLGVFVERIVGSMALSIGVFVGWPICAYFMFIYVPNGT
ncbi:MAG: hypothetical protein GDA67_00680 [Nitrospira sp. CR1.3]|nr:hypothetical protein [Nitrospira sp. CR1.3]